ncbi:unnamed protein product [Bemisia tabaci]|uniref:Uncharacterized protein n=1 Tax=Bemisia tabaci TaxID=7038 RepID=A0A9P0A7P4_BEMTA|nr:unnamed protein product [Bemisia tabaci]
MKTTYICLIFRFYLFFRSLVAMKIPTIPGPGLFPTGDYKKDGLSLFAKLIRTKNVEGMDGEISLKIRTEIKSDKKLKLKDKVE